MSSVLTEINLLRERFNRHRQGLTFLALEKEIGVSRVILSHFASGGRMGLESIVKVERWCEEKGHQKEGR